MMDFEVKERPINTLQTMMDNSKLGDVWVVYENGDNQVVVNEKMPKRYLNPDNSVKCVNGLMIYDYEEKKVVANTPQEVYDTLLDYLIFDIDLNCSHEQYEQVNNWLAKEYNVKLLGGM